MVARSLVPLASLFMACTPCAFGQLPKRLEKCLPYPTLAQEIREMQPEVKRVRVHVIRVDFNSEDGIPTDAQEETSAELRNRAATTRTSSTKLGFAWLKIGRGRNSPSVAVSSNSTLNRTWTRAASVPRAVVFGVRVHAG